MKSYDIRRLRKRLKLTQGQLAKKLDVSEHAVWKWENDRGSPNSSNLMAMYDLLSEKPASSKDLAQAVMLGGIKAKLGVIRSLDEDIEKLEDAMLSSLVSELVANIGNVEEKIELRLGELLQVS